MGNGFVQEALRVFDDVTGDTHFIKGDSAINFAGFNKYVVGDMAARKLATYGGEKWDYKYNAAEGNQLKQVNPGAVRSLTRTDDIETMSQLGVLFYQDMALVDREIEANEGIMTLAQVGAWSTFYERIASVKKTKEQQAAISIINGMERKVGGVPNFNTMENRANKPTEVTPLMAYINEWYLSCFGITTATGFTGGGGAAGTAYNTEAVATGGRWDTKQGVTVNQTKNVVNGKNIFSCQQQSYSTIDEAITGFIVAMLAAQRNASFTTPPSFPNLMPSGIETVSESMGKVWYTSGKGMDVLQAVTVTTQDLWPTKSRTDPAASSPSMRGIPIEWWPMMDTYAGTPGSSNTTLVTEGQGDRKGPRFILHDRDALTVVAHRLNWFRERTAAGETLVPDLIGRYLDVEFNLAAVDFRTSACVYPSATPSGIATY